MSIKIKNNLDLIIYFGFEDEEKLPIMDKEYQDVTKESKEYILRLSEIYENFQDKNYKITPPCVISIDPIPSDNHSIFSVSIEKDGKIKKLTEHKPKKIEEEKNKDKVEEQEKDGGGNEEIPEINTKKEIKILLDTLNEDNPYLFIDGDYSKYYKFIEKKENNTLSLEDLSLKDDNKISIDPYKRKFSKFTNFNCKIIYHDNKIIKKNFIIDINYSLEKILKKITREIKSFVLNKDFRIIYKGEDISNESLNQNRFNKIINIEEEDLIKDNQNGEINNFYLEDFTNDSFLSKGEKKKEDKDEKISNNFETKNEEKENDDQEVKEVKEKESNEEKEIQTLKEKLNECKNLCEYGFNFQNEYFNIIVPSNVMKILNFHNYQTYWYDARNSKVINLFAFDKDISIKNLNCCGSTGTITWMKVSLYESLFDKTKYIDSENLFKNYENMHRDNFWKSQNELFATGEMKINVKYQASEPELCNINNYYWIVNTPTLKIKKNKIYSLVVEFGPNNEYNYLYYNSKSSGSEKYNDELRITYNSSKGDYCMLNGFNYKLEG